MLAEERFHIILEKIEQKKTVTVQELTRLLDSSESTVRRDLVQLDKMGRLIKLHGGAAALDINYATIDVEMSVKHELNQEEKEIIAKYAAALIQPGDFTYIDAGSTTERLVEYITEAKAVYVTNSLTHGRRLAQKGFKTYILGGELKGSTEAIVGGEAVAAIQKFNFTKGFWGANGVNLHHGFTTPDVSEAMVKQKAMEHCRTCYVLCDTTKFNQISPVKFGEFQDAIIITSRLKDMRYAEYKNIVEVVKR